VQPDRSVGPFSALLRDKMAELEQEAAEQAADEAAELASADDQIGRMGLKAQLTILAGNGGPWPRAGHRAYVTPSVPPVEPGQRHLNLLH
jgi:hypothetical protein